MASLGHIAVGVALSRHAHGDNVAARFWMMLLFAAIAYLPDLDVIGWWFGVPYMAAWGHRGATHSLLFALCGGIILALFIRHFHISYQRAAIFCCLLLASHGVLDAMTDGGQGVAFFWPFLEKRYFFSWRPLPVSYLGGGFFSKQQLAILMQEAGYFALFFIYGLWPKASKRKIVKV